MFPKYLASQKKIWMQEREWKQPTENSPQEIQSGSKKENENGPLKNKCMAVREVDMSFAGSQIWKCAAGHSRYEIISCPQIDRTDRFRAVDRKLAVPVVTWAAFSWFQLEWFLVLVNILAFLQLSALSPRLVVVDAEHRCFSFMC